MGSIIGRRRKDGTMAYLAKIAIMREGVVVLREARTFDRKPAAKTWLDTREKALAVPGAIDRAKADRNDPPLADVIERYTTEFKKKLGRTNAQVLRSIKAHDFGRKKCSAIDTPALCDFAKSLECGPSTRGNYMSHLASVFGVARLMWKYPLDERTIADAQTVLRKMGIVAKSSKRARRPTLDELDRLLTHFGVVEKRRPDAIPMQKIIIFAIFSTRRQDEISRIARRDLEPGRVMVRDMKHPGEKIGNDTWCDLVPEAEAVIQSMPIADQLEINTKDMPKAERLHFHDLRHEGISRLFEMGRTIPQAAMVSGHRSWESLKRYSHLRQTGDKYANWKWLELIKGQS
jgi:integrase